MKDSDGFILVFDVTSKYTFNYISNWLKVIEETSSLDLVKFQLEINVIYVREKFLKKKGKNWQTNFIWNISKLRAN